MRQASPSNFFDPLEALVAGPLATIADLEVRLGATLSGKDLDRATANIADVSVLIRSTAGGIDWTLNADPVVPEDVRVVAIQAALRAFRNPDGFAGENIGGAYSYTYGPGAQNGVYLTAEEAALVTLAAELDGTGKPSGFTGSVRTPAATGVAGPPVEYVLDSLGYTLGLTGEAALSAAIPIQQGEDVMP